MTGKMILRALSGFVFIAFAFASLCMGVDFSQEPVRLGSGQVTTVAFGPDGTMLAAAHRTDPASELWQTQVVILWDPQTQEQVDVLEMANIRSIAFSPDGTLLALGRGEADHAIHVWDVAGQNQVGVMQSPEPGVRSIVFSPDGKTLASSGNEGNYVLLWDVQTQQLVGEFTRHTSGSVWAVTFSPDGKLLLSGGGRGDEAIRVWDVQTQQPVGELMGHSDVTMDLAFSPDGTILASAGGWNDKAVYLWDCEAQERVGMLGGHPAHIGAIAFSPDGRFLASTVYWDDTVHFWDIARQEEVGVLKGHDASDIGWNDQVAFSSDGKWLACGGENGVELWELDRPEQMLTELMLLVMSGFHQGNVAAELAWNSLVNVQVALAALDSGNFDEAQAAMVDLKVLINQEGSPRAGKITPGAAAEIIQRASEIIIIVALGH